MAASATGIRARLGCWLLPPRCLVCGAAGAKDRDLCADCHAELPWNDSACARCALPLPTPSTACGQCLQAPPSFVSCLAPLRYAAPLDRLLPRFKFHAGLAEGRLLAELILQRVTLDSCAANFGASDLLVPMPLHRRRLGQRGYNQALELARPLARAWGLRLDTQALHRTRATAAQTDLDAAARRRNVRGAFAALPECIRGRRILLLDDVITTGATVREATATLLAAGAVEVRVLAAARAPLPGHR